MTSILELTLSLLLTPSPGWAAPAQEVHFEVVEASASPSSPTVSCNVLKHREVFRKRALRELQELSAAELAGDARGILWEHHLITNKLLHDPKLWTDESVEVEVSALLTLEIHQELLKSDRRQMMIRIEGKGIIWDSVAWQLPDDVKMTVDPDQPLLHLKYPMYMVELCSEGNLAPLISVRPLRD